MLYTLRVAPHERVVLLRDGAPDRVLAPGRYSFWSKPECLRFDTRELVLSASEELLEALPSDAVEAVRVGPREYALVLREDVPVRLLPPGVHHVWTVDEAVRVEKHADTDALPEPHEQLFASLAERVELHLEAHQRAVLLREGVVVRALEPGYHAFWSRRVKAQVLDTNQLLVGALGPELLAALPAAWYETVSLGIFERAVLFLDGRPVRFLRPGMHRVWRVNPGLEVRRYVVTDPAPELTDELRALIPQAELLEAQVRQFEKGLVYVNGRFERVLEPGRFTFWSHPAARVAVQVMDTRVQQLKIEGQELMTRDKVTLRLTLVAEYAPVDGPATVHAVADVKEALYLATQLAAREFVAGVSLDELLEGRDALTRHLEAQVVPRAENFGVRVQRVGVKDVILPGEMRSLLNKVLEAEKSAAANVILRREDAAATRNMANTAKVLADNPVLLRLKELETMKEVADRIDKLELVVGAMGLDALFPATRGSAPGGS